MTKRKNLHTNITLENCRRDRVYEAIITDLTITGIVPVATAEMLLGYSIPSYLHTPDGKTIDVVVASEKAEDSKLKALKQVKYESSTNS